MILAAELWAIVAMMQLCMISQVGRKKLDYNFLNLIYLQNFFRSSAFIFLSISLYFNCLENGLSVGVLTWIFLITTSAFFLQILFFYNFREWFFIFWIFLVFLASFYSLILPPLS